MRLGMMQPYFFPYVGYFALLQATDCWVVFDTAQYIRRGWVNRNRVLSSGAAGWKYVRVPVRHAARETRICDMQIDSGQDWRQELLQNLDAYERRRAPFYRPVCEWLQHVLQISAVQSGQHGESAAVERLSVWLIHLLRATCDYLDLPFRCQVLSQMDLPLPVAADPGDWALQVATAVRADTYINAPGGRHLFDRRAFDAAGVRLQFLDPQLVPYSQGGTQPFVPGLSILDLLMWNSPDEVRRLTQCYTLAAE